MATRSVAPAYVAVILAALLPRVVGLGQFVTIDEVNSWMVRSAYFLRGISTGDLSATAQSAHPGVTTMWLGALGLLLHAALAARSLIDPADFTTRLALMQLMPALVNSAAVVAGFWLLRRLLAPRVALLSALLWALDPFVIGYSRVLHVDGLMGSFATLSMLCACVYWRLVQLPGRSRGDLESLCQPVAAASVHAANACLNVREAHLPADVHGSVLGPGKEQRSTGLLAASGALAALAVLSKSPGVALAPTVALIAAWSAWRGGRPWQRALRDLLIWGAAAALAALLIWPALWAAPDRAFGKLLAGVTEEGGEPHQSGNYFLGAPTAVPGPLIYPVAMALRLTPWAMLGLGLLGLLWRRTPPGQRPALGAAALFAIIFTVEIAIFPKQFDRYLMPIFPALDLLAAAGLWAAIDAARDARWRAGLVSGIVAAAMINVAWWHPYNLIAFNQLLGGARTGESALRMGWGEGLEEVAAWLNQQPNIGEVVTVSTAVSSLHPYMRPGSNVEFAPSDGALPDKAGYVVIYLRSTQDGRLDEPFRTFAALQRPVYTVTIHGVAYAQIYEVVPQPQHELRAAFGEDIELLGYDLTRGAGSLALTLHWATTSAPPDASLFIHLLGDDGQRRAQADLPALTAGWVSGRHYHTRVELPLPADLPGGAYQLAIGLYDPQSFARLPLAEGPSADPAAGADALLLTTVRR
jgi:4-amino-4-deoxy-L-arabinose transferase-like glycosyltransferase